MSECTHTRTSRFMKYEHCEDCGASRKLDHRGEPVDAWHVCDLCRTATAQLAEVVDSPRESDDPRLDYVLLQVDRDLLKR